MGKRRRPREKSLFEISRAHQQHEQSVVLKKIGKTEQLPYALAQATHALAEEFMDSVGNLEKTACKKRCSYCCHQPATVFAFEAIQIARTLRSSLRPEELDAMRRKMKDRVARFRNSSVRASINDKSACPLLVDHQCSIYSERPLTCRMAHSFSLPACRRAFDGNRAEAKIPISLSIQTGLSGILEEAFEGLPDLGFDGGLYELCSAVLKALETPEAATRWTRGDRTVFADCIRDDT